MAKKVYDIIPPKLAKKIEKDVKEYLKEETVQVEKKPGRQPARGRVASPVALWKKSLIAGIAVFAVVAVFLFFRLPKANVEIWPNVQTLSFQQTLTADESASILDLENAIIPAESFEISKTLTEKFPATGNASDQGKASGKITIYNKYDPPAPVTFKPGTHFLSDSGKLFRADERVVIPAAKKSGSKITPGSVEIKVTAVEGGEDYNISGSNFSVPGLKGSAYYYSIYASSEKPMTGGFSTEVKKVTENDIEEAKEALIKKLEVEAIAELKNKMPEDYILLEDGIFSEITGAGTQTKIGSVAGDFDYEATINASALAFKKSDIEDFVRKYIAAQAEDGKIILDNSLKINYLVKKSEEKGSKMAIQANFSAGVYKSIDKNSMAISLTGKNAEQINETVKGFLGEELSKTEVKFWPFWVNKSPKNQKAVNVNLIFE